MTKDPDEAMDIAQETFVKVHRYLPSFKGDSSFFTWTYRIATNLCLDAQRRRGRMERVDLEQGDEAEVEAAMDPPSAALAGPQRQALQRRAQGQDRGGAGGSVREPPRHPAAARAGRAEL